MKNVIMISSIACLVLLSGCAGDSSAPSETAPAEPSATPQPTGDGSDEDLFKQWGPSQRPERTDALEFFYWRVDEMFRRSDADKNGMIDLEEFDGERLNFDRIDVNGDGFVTKKELIEDNEPVMPSGSESSQ